MNKIRRCKSCHGPLDYSGVGRPPEYCVSCLGRQRRMINRRNTARQRRKKAAASE